MMELWPFTNFHDLNQDWIIKKIRNVEDSEAAAKASEEAASGYADDAKGYMQDAKSAKTQAAIFATQAGDRADDAAASAASIANVADQVAINTGRIDNIVANAGDGTIPSELVDARTEFTGYTNTTAGAAIRAADDYVETLLKFTNQVKEVAYTTTPGYVDYSGNITAATSAGEVTSNMIDMIPGYTCILVSEYNTSDAPWCVCGYYRSDDSFIARSSYNTINRFMTFHDSQNVNGRTRVIEEYSFPYDWDNSATKMKLSWRSYSGRTATHIYLVKASGSRTNAMLPPIVVGNSSGVQKITLDTTTKTITIPNDSWIIMETCGDSAAALQACVAYIGTATSGQSISASYTGISTTLLALLYDIPSRTIEWVAASDSSTRDPDKIVLALMRTVGDNVSITINAPYTVDGYDYGIRPKIEAAEPWRFNKTVNSVNHRGYNTVAPENTLPAFRMSKAKGFDIVECDVEMTSDNVPVILHDATINRTARNADGTTIDNPVDIHTITYAQALTYDFGVWKSADYTGTKIPSFEEFVTCCKQNGLDAYVELKADVSWTSARITNLCNIIEAAGMKEHITFISFGLAALNMVKSIDASYRLGYIVGAATTTDIDTCVNSGFDFLDASSVDNTVISYADSHNIELEMWTINSALGMTGADPYITGFTSDVLVAQEELFEYQQSL